jgi:hypothetical protein
MKPPLPHSESAVPRTPHAQLEIARAIRTLMAPDEDELLRRRRAEIIGLRRDLEVLAGDIRKAFEEAAALLKADLRATLQKYSPDQPRVSAGNPDGGQWTREEGGSQRSTSSSRISTERSGVPVRYASLEISPSNVLADAPASGTRYAAGNESNEENEREGGMEPSPGQLIRLDVAQARLNDLIAQARKIDQNWSPSPGVYKDIEGKITNLEARAQEAEEFLARLRGLGFPRDLSTGRRFISPPNTKTGDPLIDSTTEKLMDLLGDVMDGIGPRADLDPGRYGTRVHTDFAEMLRAKGLPGIEPNDVERTFSLTDKAFYGAKYSIRPDAILRRDTGDIAAIYDIKTGRGMSELRVIKIRYMTDSGRTIPVIELNRVRGAILKRR